MNFLRGELVGVDGGLAVQVDGVKIPVAGYKADEAMTAGRKVVLGVRPEHIGVDVAGAATAYDAVVDIEEPMGADNLLWLKFAGHTVGVRIAGSRRYAPGTHIKLSLDMSLASLFDAGTELRI
jgi:multiple sugar transport system ATP-binding protein